MTISREAYESERGERLMRLRLTRMWLRRWRESWKRADFLIIELNHTAYRRFCRDQIGGMQQSLVMLRYAYYRGMPDDRELHDH